MNRKPISTGITVRWLHVRCPRQKLIILSCLFSPATQSHRAARCRDKTANIVFQQLSYFIVSVSLTAFVLRYHTTSVFQRLYAHRVSCIHRVQLNHVCSLFTRRHLEKWKMDISRQRFDRSAPNLARWRKLTLRIVGKLKFPTSKNPRWRTVVSLKSQLLPYRCNANVALFEI